MSIVVSKAIPLASGTNHNINLFSLSLDTPAFFTDINGNRILRPMLLGNRVEGESSDIPLPNDETASTDSGAFSKMDLVSYQNLPVYKDQLVSATLVLSCTSVPLYGSSFPIKVSTTENTNIVPSDDYNTTLGLSRYDMSVDHNLTVGSNNIDITSLIDYATSSFFWSTNNRFTFFVEALTSANNLLYINLYQSYVFVQYNAVQPFSPLGIEALPGFNQIFVSWLPPSDDGGSTIIDYTVEYRLIDSNNLAIGEWMVGPTTNTNSVAVNNLSNNQQYIFRVRARNAVGIGLYSTISPIISPEYTAAPRVSSTYNDANYTRIRLRRDTSASWRNVNPVLGLGEAGYETDTRFLKVGDNIAEWNDLQYVKVPNESITFPDFPDTNLIVGDGEFGVGNNRIICNLSDGERLNIVGKNGITSAYSDIHKAVVLSLTQTYNPIYSGTLYSPATSGQPGNVAHDEQWLYVCVQNNFWKKLPLEQYWFDPTIVSVSNNSGSYPSITTIAFSGSNMIVSSNGDPYPAKAGQNLTSDGLTPRLGFFGSYDIQDQSYYKVFRYRGPSFSSNPDEAVTEPIGIMNNGVVCCGARIESNTLNIFNVPSGLKFNKLFFSTYFQLDACGGEVIFDRSYRYSHGGFLKNCWNNELFINSSSYYKDSSFEDDYFRHPDGHSKIVGFCFDGYPIYGPYAYIHPEQPASGVTLATSSYVPKQTDDHRPPDWKFNNAVVINNINYMLTTGAFVDDFDFFEGSGLLDQYNGRFSITPEYPEGVYAYYLTFTDSTLSIPKYPYIVGPYSRQQRSQ